MCIRDRNLLDLEQRAHRRLFHPFDASGGGPAKAQRHCYRLFIVQEERRHLGAGAQLVSAFRAGGGMDGIAERAQLVDIAAESAAGHFEAVREIGTRPIAASLEQRKQAKQPRGRLQHVTQCDIS